MMIIRPRHSRLRVSRVHRGGEREDAGIAKERVLAGRYRLGGSLGRGGFSEVHSAEDGVLGRVVAVKLLAGAAGQPDRARRFDREARALARLSHPNVVAVYDAGLDGPDAYVVMELLAGPSLAEL